MASKIESGAAYAGLAVCGALGLMGMTNGTDIVGLTQMGVTPGMAMGTAAVGGVLCISALWVQ
jgi:hypothetical protein